MSTPHTPDSPTDTPLSIGALDIRGGWTQGLFDERHLRHFLDIEIKRSERTSRPFLLVSVDIGEVPGSRRNAFLRTFAQCIEESTRGTDARGWLVKHRVAGIICVEASEAGAAPIMTTIRHHLTQTFGSEKTALIKIEAYAYPKFNNTDGTHPPLPPHVHDWIAKRTPGKLAQHAAKRMLDISGALVGIALFSPILVTIPILIKLTSPGPALFKQLRVGRGGRKFQFYKFRSMHLNNDDKIHREFVANLIKGESQKSADGKEIFKIERDPRITSIGRIIRKASLDELPQLFNVLLGHMSLVGPRPAIPYEVEQYKSWHLGRVVSVKPGITGLWQVEGRSRTTFEAMTRMDVRYARRWSVLWDVAIIVKTPFSVLAAKGAR